MYSVADFGDMIADRRRLDAYAEAIRQVVRPGSVVLDLGAGTGILSLIACQCRARTVYAVDPLDSVHLARQVAQDNGFGDRIKVIQKRSTEVHLPEPVDVIISDLRGVLPAFGASLAVILDARRRFLAPGGRLIPKQDLIWLAPLEAPELSRRTLGPWEFGPFGLDLRSALRVVTNSHQRTRANPEQLLSEPSCWARLDYDTIASPHVQGTARCRVQRTGTVHGLLLWFDSVLTDGVFLSNAPGMPPLIYGQMFFPWPEPVPLREGDLVEVQLSARLVGGQYVWCWESTMRDENSPERIRCRFQQSTFQGALVSNERLRKQAAGYVPRPNEEGQICQFLLDRMRGEAALGELARELADRFPGRFSRWEDALTYLGDFSIRYSD